MESSEHNRSDGGLRGLLDTLWRIHTRDETAVLGIVIATDGSTYQKPGAVVLLDATGLRHGVISGGCLEPALEHAAQQVHASGCAATIDFDTRTDEDLLFGSGIGCRGRVQLLLLPVPPQAPLARALFGALDQGAVLELALTTQGENTGAGTATYPASSTLVRNAQWNRNGRASETPGPASEVSADLILQIVPPPRVLLLGAGPETAPLAVFARSLGWFVGVVEHRGRWSAFAQRTSIDRLIELAPEAALAVLAEERADAIVVMSHNYAIDLTYLRFCARSAAHYIGLLGPAARRDALLAELEGADLALLQSRLHAPVGLDLGGHGPQAIALAISAELQQHFAARTRNTIRPLATVEHA